MRNKHAKPARASRPAPTRPDSVALVSRIRTALATDRERTTVSLRSLRRALTRELKMLSGATVLHVAHELIAPASGCPRWIAYELVHFHPQAMAQLSPRWLERLGGTLASWGEVDAFACYLLGPAWRTGKIRDVMLERWAASKDRWRRRSALVATVALNTPARGGHGDAPRTLALCTRLLDDRDDMVVKALSWALRALAVREPAAVAEYLDQHQARLAARVLREVRNKLVSGLKNPRRGGSASGKAARNHRQR